MNWFTIAAAWIADLVRKKPATIEVGRVWIVGKRETDSDSDRSWEFQGVFSTEARAVAACKSRFYFVGPAKMDEELPEHSATWSGSYFPKAEAFDADTGPEIVADNVRRMTGEGL